MLRMLREDNIVEALLDRYRRVLSAPRMLVIEVLDSIIVVDKWGTCLLVGACYSYICKCRESCKIREAIM